MARASATRLASRETASPRSQHGVVTLRQTKHQFVHPGCLSGGYDRDVNGSGFSPAPNREARYVVPNRTGDQSGLLRHVADVASNPIAVPVCQIGAVKPHRAQIRREGSGGNTSQRGLASAARPDDPENLARGHFEGHAAEKHRPLTWRSDNYPLKGQGPRGCGQLGAASGLAGVEKELGKVVERSPRLANQAPGFYQLLDRLEGAAE